MEITEFHPFKSVEAKENYLKLYDEWAKEWPILSEIKMVETSYGETFVRISGPKDAPPLVLLHTMASNSLMWIPNIEELSKNYRTYAVDDIYGHGRSTYTKIIKNPEDFANWLDELFNALELGNNINLVGISYGGWQTSQYALKFPEKLNKIVMIAPAATVLPVSAGFMIRGFLALIPADYFYKKLTYWSLGDFVKKDKEKAENRVNQLLIALKAFKSKRWISSVLDDDELKSIKVPALYMVGENEKFYSARKALQRLSNVAPQIKTELIPEAGHDLLFVQTEMCNKKILEFLKELNAKSTLRR